MEESEELGGRLARAGGAFFGAGLAFGTSFGFALPFGLPRGRLTTSGSGCVSFVTGRTDGARTNSAGGGRSGLCAAAEPLS